MSNKSGVSEQVISLPDGGGALHAIGETFSPDLHTGTGNSTIPVDLPAGRNGFQPELSLSYSTGNGNSPFGLERSFSVPSVTLKTSKGIPCYQGQDAYVLWGAEDPVPVPNSTGWAWGENTHRQIGGSPSFKGLPPIWVMEIESAVAAAGNEYQSLAPKENGIFRTTSSADLDVILLPAAKSVQQFIASSSEFHCFVVGFIGLPERRAQERWR